MKPILLTILLGLSTLCRAQFMDESVEIDKETYLFTSHSFITIITTNDTVGRKIMKDYWWCENTDFRRYYKKNRKTSERYFKYVLHLPLSKKQLVLDSLNKRL